MTIAAPTSVAVLPAAPTSVTVLPAALSTAAISPLQFRNHRSTVRLCRCGFFLEPTTRFELVTSSLPRTRSAD